MKLIKKIAAIMFAFMMIFSLSTNVKAEEATKGTITIKNAKKDETYTVYKVLTLDSYNPKSNLYSYLPANDAWKTYFENSGNQFMSLNKDGYVTMNYKDANVQELSQVLIKQAKIIADTNYEIRKEAKANKDGELVIEDLSLGYYVIDSTVGTLCALTTNHPNAIIEKKHNEPIVDKNIILENGEKSKINSAFYGESVTFETKLTLQPGAKNYVFHDKMSDGLSFQHGFVNIYASDTGLSPNATDYQLVYDSTGDGCSFHIVFTDEYLNKINKTLDITMGYQAIVNNNATINTAMKNEAWLTYGNKQETGKSTTETYTFGIPVFKYTNDGLTKKGLDGVKFSLYTNKECSENNILKFEENGQNYLYKKDNTGAITILNSQNGGYLNINGLKAGTYYLKEISTLDGYNKLKNPIKVVINQGNDGKPVINVDDKTEPDTRVEVLNNTGSILPSTGGMGTTLIYLIGGALVLGSGFVLINKKRAKAK